jgi:hypothetical protein
MPNEIDLIIVFAIEILLERQDDEQAIDAFLDAMDAAAMPGPELWGDVVEHADTAGVGPAGDAQVEARIVDEDQRIGLPLKDILLAERQVAEDGRQIFDDLPEAHEGQVAVVFDEFGAGMGHEIAAPGPDIGIAILLMEGLKEVATVEIPGSLAGYDIIAHDELRRGISRN